jgi:hypothetical protein
MTIAISTKTTISAWVQIQKGDTRPDYGAGSAAPPYPRWP